MANFNKLNGYNAKDKYSRDTIADIEAYIGYKESDIYGLEVDYVNQTYTRLAGAEFKTPTDFNNILPWSGVKRCNLADNGTVNAYYGDNDYIEDGTNGQVMVEIPKFYYRVVPLILDPITETVSGETVTYEGYHIRKANYYISMRKYEGFKIHPLFINENGDEVDHAYIGAYEGSMYDVSASEYYLENEQTVDDNADKFSSVAIPHNHDFDGTVKLVHGVKPTSYDMTSFSGHKFTRMVFEQLCENRGTGWYSFTSKAHSAIMMLLMVEYASLNTQTVVGKGNSNSEQLAYNGATSSLGNASGSATSTITYDGTVQTDDDKVSVSYRGLENLWGNYRTFVIDINVHDTGSLRGGKPYICSDFVFAEKKITDNYKSVGFCLSRLSGYISSFGYGDPDYDWIFLPSETSNNNANSVAPVGDYAFCSSSRTKEYKVAYIDGIVDDQNRCGGFFWCLYNGDLSGGALGGRIIYIPTTA